MTRYRLTQGAGGALMGSQVVLYEGAARNAIEFVKDALDAIATDEHDRVKLIKTTWVDAGEGTLPIDVQNLVF